MAEDTTSGPDLTDAQKKIREVGKYIDDSEDYSDDYEYPAIEDIVGKAKNGSYKGDIRALYQGAKHNYDGARKGIRSIVMHEFGRPAIKEFNQNYVKNLNGAPFNMETYQDDLKNFRNKFKWGTDEFKDFIYGENGVKTKLDAGAKVAEGYNPKNLPKYFYLLDKYKGAEDQFKSVGDIDDDDFKEAARLMGYGGDQRVGPSGKKLYYGYDNERNFIRDESGRPKIFEDDGKMQGNNNFRPVPGKYADDYDLWELLAPAYYTPEEKPNIYHRYIPDVGELPADLDKMISRNPLLEFNPYQTTQDMRNVSRYLKNVDTLNNGQYDPSKFAGSAEPSYLKMDRGRKRLAQMMRDIEDAYGPLKNIDPGAWDNSTDPSTVAAKEEVLKNLADLVKTQGDKGSWQDYANDYLGAYHHYSSDLQKRLDALEQQNPELANRLKSGLERMNGMPDMLKALAGGMAYESYPYKDMMAYNLDPEKQRAAYAGNLDMGLYGPAGVETTGIPKDISKEMAALKKVSPQQYQQLLVPSMYENKKYNELRKTVGEKDAQNQLADLRGSILFAASNYSADQVAAMLTKVYGMPPEEAAERAKAAVEASQYAEGITGRKKLSRAQQTMAEGHNKADVAAEDARLAEEASRQDRINEVKSIKEQFDSLLSDGSYTPTPQTKQLKKIFDNLVNRPDFVLSSSQIDGLLDLARQITTDAKTRASYKKQEDELNENPEGDKIREIEQAEKEAYANKMKGIRNTRDKYFYSVKRSEEAEDEFSEGSVKKMESFEEMMKENDERNSKDVGYRQGIPVHSQVFKNTAYPVILGNDGRDWLIQEPAKKISDEGSVRRV